MKVRKRLSPHLDPTDETPLFTTNLGRAYDFWDLSNFVTNIIKQTNFDFTKYKRGNVTPHWFRHYFAQEAHRSGASLVLSKYIRIYECNTHGNLFEGNHEKGK
ncbi:hypothetical protein [Neobacillus cucumis]|uniref:hypothetical protein n=1 Tax=Neobacillus cucumis TaxID=1740721 RepID=UPI002853683B|nr:hypothetical protein [Neobacillus cucumis]MDR4950351.1 hypothetical protein [Neobacillus cucumis]